MIEVTFDHDNDNIEVRNGKGKILCEVKCKDTQATQFIFSEVFNRLFGLPDDEFHLTIREQSDGERKTIEEW